MLRGRLAVSRIDLIGPRLFLQYSKENGLALSFGAPHAAQPVVTLQPDNAETVPLEEQGRFSPHAAARAINLSKTFSNLFSVMRHGKTSAYLTGFGIRDATVLFDRGDQTTNWKIPTVQFKLKRVGKRSELLGEMQVDTSSGTWQTEFQARQHRKDKKLHLMFSMKDINPNGIAKEFPTFTFPPEVLDLPISVDMELEVAKDGDILAADIRASSKAGKIDVPWDFEPKHPAQIDSADLHVAYSRKAGEIDLKSANLRWDDSIVSMSGGMKRQPSTGEWNFHVKTDTFRVGAKYIGIPAIQLDKLSAQGRYDPKQGITHLEQFVLQGAPNAKISLSGKIINGAKSPGIQLSGDLSPMTIIFPKLIWPPFIANGAREWIGERLPPPLIANAREKRKGAPPKGRITGGSININIPPDLLANIGKSGIPHEAVDIRVNFEDLEMHYLDTLPPIQVPQATASFTGHRFFFAAPKGYISLPSGERVNFSDGEFLIGDLRPRYPEGEVHFKTQSSVAAALELLDQPRLSYVKALNFDLPDVSGEATSTFSIAFPLVRQLKFDDLRINGRAHVEDVRIRDLPVGLAAHEGKFDFKVSEKDIAAHGEAKIGKVPVAVVWKRAFKAEPEQREPLRIRAILGTTLRKKLGLNLSKAIHGPVPAELTIAARKNQSPALHFRANLTNAMINLSTYGWFKKAGKKAVLNVDLEKDGRRTVLRNLNILGDDLEVRGEILFNEELKPTSFSFPTAKFNNQTQISLYGELKPNSIWSLRTSGKIFDGRQFFRSLFSPGQLAKKHRPLKNSPGVDIHIDLDKVVGFFDTNAANVSVRAQRRKGKLVSLDLHGQLMDSHGRLSQKKQIAARVRAVEGKPRILKADTTDAGAAFRLIGFYPSARGGDAWLRVNLDGSGKAEKTGRLLAKKFVVMQNQVIGEVLSEAQKKSGRRARVRTPYISFDQLYIPFSVGSGQFVLHNGAAIVGPSLGITMRGKIDFEKEYISLSGTYTPAYGLTGAIGSIPLFGELLTGRKGEGVFGLTFAIRGPLSRPQVQANPLSIFTPGPIRQIMEFDHIIPRDQQSPKRKTRRSRSRQSNFQAHTD
jgi:hypothetical protein